MTEGSPDMEWTETGLTGKSGLTRRLVSVSRVVRQVGLGKGQEIEVNLEGGARPAKGGKGSLRRPQPLAAPQPSDTVPPRHLPGAAVRLDLIKKYQLV